MNWIFIALLTIAAQNTAAATPPATPLPPHRKIELADVMWQALPSRIVDVSIGPDDRMWYQLFPIDQPHELADVKRFIEREFNERAPQFSHARVALFEPNGRVWFVHEGRKADAPVTLLGYDGKSWIERPIAPPDRMRASPQNHGHGPYDGENLACDGRAFFVRENAVLTFDGEAFSQQLFQPTNAKTRKWLPILRVEPDGKGVIAAINGCDDPVWRWRDGKWSPIPLPLAGLEYVHDIAPTLTGGVWARLGDQLQFIRYDAPNVPVVKWVLQLDSQDEREREHAYRSLQALDPEVLPRLERLLMTKAEDLFPTSKDRLKKLIDELRERRKTLRQRERVANASSFGPFKIQKARFLFSDGRGNVFTGGEKIWRANDPVATPQPGFVMLDRDGDYVPMRDASIAARWQSLSNDSNNQFAPLVVAEDGRTTAIWMPGDHLTLPPALFDIRKGRIIAECPDVRFFYLYATKSDGTLIVDDRSRHTGWEAAFMALRPSAKDNRAVLQPFAQLHTTGAFAIADDGTITATNEAGVPARLNFETKNWDALRENPDDVVFRRMIAGREGAILAQHKADDGWSLIVPPAMHSAPALDELLQSHHKEIAKAFAGASMIGYSGAEPAMAIDGSGNIWFAEQPEGRLRVLINGKWHDAGDDVILAGMKTGNVHFLASIGDSDSVYMTDFTMFHENGNSLIGRVIDGKLSFTLAPHAMEDHHMGRPIRDPVHQALWVPSLTGYAGKDLQGRDRDYITGEFATGIAEHGLVENIRNGQVPVLADAGGNVWTLTSQYEPDPKIRVWHTGRLAAAIPMAGLDQTSRYFSDRVGSVWMWNRQGLRHFVETKPDTGAYVLDQIYSIAGLSEYVTHAELAPSGYLVLLETGGGRVRYNTLYIIRLPNAPAARDAKP